MNWAGIRAVVTGADGFIGSHLAEMLVERGATVTALAFYNSFDSCGWLDESRRRKDMLIVRGDVRDAEQMTALLKDQEYVFHLAALISVPHSYLAPRSHVETNVLGTLNVLCAARANGLRRVVVTSTSEVYGTAKERPMPEGHPIHPQSPYAASKVGADALAEAFRLSYGLEVAVLRPFNTYGPRQSERAVIPTIIRQALDPKAKEIKLGSLETERDFLYVTDTAEAFLAVAGVDSWHLGWPFNAGTGESISIGALAQKIRAVTACSKEIVAAEVDRMRPAASEVFWLQADATHLRRGTGWAPQTAIDGGLFLTIEWWRKRLGLVRSDLAFVA